MVTYMVNVYITILNDGDHGDIPMTRAQWRCALQISLCRVQHGICSDTVSLGHFGTVASVAKGGSPTG